MTEATKITLSSNRVLRAALTWGGIIGAVVIAGAALIGFFVAGTDGMWSGVAGASVGVIFPALTALSIVIANRWYGQPGYLTIFFAFVMGFWLVKFVIVLALLFALRDQPWLHNHIFFFSVFAAAVASLIVDLIVVQKMRLPAVSDIELPETNPED